MYLPQYGYRLSRIFLSEPNHDFEKVFVNPKLGKYNPQNLAPCHSEPLSYLKTLTCKWRLNCAGEPNSLQTDARHHGTFKGQRKKKPRNSKKGTMPTPPRSKQTHNHMTKIIRRLSQKAITPLYGNICYVG